MAAKAINPHIVLNPVLDRGTAQALAALERRINTIESKIGIVGAGSIGPVQVGQINGTSNIVPGSINTGSIAVGAITATTIAAQAISTYLINGNTITLATGLSTSNKVLLDSTGIRAYDASGGTPNVTIAASDGSITVTKGTITGAIIQTGGSVTGVAGSNKVMMDSTGLNAYDGTGVNTVTIDTNGQLTVRRGSITLSGTVPAGTTARVTLDSSGIKGYATGNPTPQFLLDATTGLITATGVITNQPGSTVPWQTSGFFIGGGNLLPNASAEDPTSTRQLVYFNTGNTVTAGTFILKYGSGTATGTISWNSTAAQMQTALNAAGVLPSGVTASCSGGPLPGTPIVVDLSGAGLTPTVLTVQTSSLTGGSALTGPVAATGYNTSSWPSSWWQSTSDALDYTAVSYAWHGGNVFRLTAVSTTTPTMTNSVKTGPLGLVTGSKYTLSAFYRSAAATGRNTVTTITFYDASNVSLGSTASTPKTVPVGSWVRDYVVATVPTNAVYMSVQFGVSGAASGEVYYIDGTQLEYGDAPTAFAPRPDEIIANTVQANMINVAQLSAISANLGNIVAGTLNAVTINASTISGTNTITGAIMQTSSSDPKVAMDSTGIYMTNSSGTKLITLNPSNGLEFSEASGSAYNATDALSWSDSGGVVREWIQGTSNGGDHEIVIEAKASINDVAILLCSAVSGGVSNVQIQAGGAVRVVLNSTGISDFPFLQGGARLQQLGLPARAYRSSGYTITLTGSQTLRADSTAYDPGSHMSTSGIPIVYTCPATGYYLFVGQVQIQTSSSSWLQAQVLQNVTPNGGAGAYTGGSVVAQGVQIITSGSNQYASVVCDIIHCNQADTLQLGFTVGAISSSSEVTGSSARCYYTVQQVA